MYSIVRVLIFAANFSFYLYTLVYVIEYIAMYKYIRDIVFLSLGGCFFTGFLIVSLVHEIKEESENGFFEKYFPGDKARFPMSF